MTTVDASRYKSCALCNRWQGDANLTSQGAGRGQVRFDIRERGKCAIRGGQLFSATDGTACKDFSISEKARAFRL